MASQRLTKHNIAIVAAAVSLSKERQADALLILLDGATDWKRIVEITEGLEKPVIVAVDAPDDLEGAAELASSQLLSIKTSHHYLSGCSTLCWNRPPMS